MPLAIFDLDHTLINGDSDYSWGQFLVERELVDRAEYEVKNEQFYQDYVNSTLDPMAYLEFAVGPLAQYSLDELAGFHRDFMEAVIAPMWQPKAEALLEKHRSAGDTLLVITSTNRFIVEPICHKLGITEIIAARPEIIDGSYTGKITGGHTFQHGKVEQLNRWLKKKDESLEGAWFYSDSINDLPLMEVVDNPVAVDPDDKLRAEAEQRGWKIISLR